MHNTSYIVPVRRENTSYTMVPKYRTNIERVSDDPYSVLRSPKTEPNTNPYRYNQQTENEDYNKNQTTTPYNTRMVSSPAMSILCLTTISEVNPHLYICGANAVNEYKVRAKGITFIVNVTLDFPNLRVPGVETLAIRIDDSTNSQLYPYFDTVADRIKDVSLRAGKSGMPGKALIHCMVGASRSATLVLAYLMKHRKMSLMQAYHFLKRVRPVIRPNIGFFQQLVKYEYQLFGCNTVKMVNVGGNSRGLIPDLYLNEF